MRSANGALGFLAGFGSVGLASALPEEVGSHHQGPAGDQSGRRVASAGMTTAKKVVKPTFRSVGICANGGH